jgi:hypothetical protein
MRTATNVMGVKTKASLVNFEISHKRLRRMVESDGPSASSLAVLDKRPSSMA